jgi:DNA-binding beta-propeller fold protein YncE
VQSYSNGMAVSRDGSTLFVSDYAGGSHAIHAVRVANGSRPRIIGGKGSGPLQFKNPLQVWVASDDCLFVADYGNSRVQVLTPRLGFHSSVGVDPLSGPAGVCANDAVIVVSEFGAHRISVFNRGDGALLRRFGSGGSGDGELQGPSGLCFMSDHRHVAVADCSNHRVSVFSVEGEFVRHVGVGKLSRPSGVACSAFDEIVVADWGNHRVVMFSASGEVLTTMGRGDFTGVAIHGGTIVAQDIGNKKCVMFEIAKKLAEDAAAATEEATSTSRRLQPLEDDRRRDRERADEARQAASLYQYSMIASAVFGGSPSSGSGGRFYKGGQFTPGGGRAPKGGGWY